MPGKLSKIGLSILMVICLVFGSGSTVHAQTVDEQMDTIKSRLKDYFLELDTIDDGAKVETCYVSQAEVYFDMMNEDGSFDDVDYQSTQNAANGGAWAPYLALDRLQAIAIAYHKEGNALYHKDEVITKLNQAIVHWNSIESGLSTTLKGPRSTNWWENQVGVQLRFSRIALFMEDIMSEDAMNIMLTKLKEKTPVKYGTGQNNLWFDQNWVYHAIITEDADELKDKVTNYLDYCLLTQLDDNTAEAVQVDNSYYMHGRQFYSNGYGLSMFRDMSFWIYMLRGTDFAICDEMMERMADYMINGTSWTLRGDIMELYLGYRPYSYEVGYKNYASAYIDPLKRMIASDSEHAFQYQAILDNIEGKNTSNGKSGNYYMWRSGYASHMREGYGVNIKMDSNTIIGGEWRGSWTGTNYGQLIYWTSSAASTITVDGDEYTNVFPVYDWAHCPGTTTPARIVQDFSNSGRFTNGTAHTIGVTDGTYGSTSYVMNKKDTQATKGYFFFDNEFVALGAGISSKETTAIHTTLNQCEADNVVVDGQTVDLGTEQDYSANYIYNDKIGYVFLDETQVHISNVKQNKVDASLWDEDKQKESAPVFTAYLNHGVQPVNGSYAYIVVPNTTASAVETYADDIPVTVIANTADVQAVRHDELKQTQINFYKAGTLEYKKGYTITVDHACNVMIDESGDVRKITVAVNDQEDHQVVNVGLEYENTKTTTTFVSQALPYAGQSMTLVEGEDNRYQASSAADDHSVMNVVDGDTNTYWQSNDSGEQWISLFTGTDQFIKNVQIQWGENAAQNYDVYISQDGVTYTKVQSITDGRETAEIGAICHYVKIVMTSSSGENYQIKEISFQPSQLLSQGKETETSSQSTQAPTYTGNLVVDGDLSTRWASQRNTDDNWITIDLGKKAKIDAIEIVWEAACSDNYQIEVSDDNKNWTTVKSSLKTDTSLTDKIVFEETAEGRYVKLHSLKSRTVSGTNYGINVFELKVYGEYKRAEENIALNQTTYTSSVSTFNETAKKMVGACAVDGDKTGNSRWASLRNTDDNWITIDLGQQALVDDIMIYWETSSSDNYRIEVSDDNENWEIIQSECVSGSGNNPIDKISFEESVSTRYIKVHSLKSRSYQYGINIYEIEVYGTYEEEIIPEVNIALNKPAVASSVYQGYTAERAFDGSVSGTDASQSRWVSLRKKDNTSLDDAQWIYVDLQDYYNLSKVVLNWEGACGKEYKIQVSTDGENWTDISHVTDGTAGIVTFTYDEDIIARYVKMQGIEPVGIYGYSLWEFEVYGELTELPEENIALNKPATTSSVYQGYTAERAFDGSVSGTGANQSRWVSLRKKENANLDDAQWIYVDLQDYYNLSKVVLNWEGWAAKEYKLQVSLDGKTWEDIEHITDGQSPNDQGYIKEFVFDEDIVARYVKMQGVEPGNIYGYSLWEFEVYGELMSKDIIKEIYDEYQTINRSLYTSSSLEAFDEVLKTAMSVYNSENISREQIIQTVEQMINANSLLVEKADKTGLESVIQQAQNIDEGLYTSKSLEALEDILNEVQEVYEDENATDIEVKAAINKLEVAMQSLVEKADKAELKKVIENAENVNKDLYTPSSVKTLEDVLSCVETVYADDNATEEEVTNAINMLTKAYGQLVARADKNQLKKMIDEVEALDETVYTTESFNALQASFIRAKEVLDNAEETQDEVDKAVKDLNNAISQLEKIERTALNNLLLEVKDIDMTKYTDESVKSLEAAIEKAEKVLTTTDQKAIDEAYEELKAAQAELKEKENKPEEPSQPENPDKDPSIVIVPGTPEQPVESIQPEESQETVVNTGDHHTIALYGSLSMIALLGVGISVFMKKRKD